MSSQKFGIFFFEFDHVLPFNAFLNFQNQLNIAFHSIAQVDYTIQTRQPELTTQTLGDYWEWVVNNSGISSSMKQELCNHQVPTLTDSRVTLLAENEIVKNFLTGQALGPIEAKYVSVGFPKFSIHTMVDETASQEKIQEFKRQKEKNDAELAQKAQVAIEKANTKRSAAGTAPAGLGQIGRKIKDSEDIMRLVDIQEEERSVVIEGYVFDKEVRVLRSGRQLLTLKITDYTSSIVAKKFSRDDSDEALFADFNEGDWVKVRGSVQEDNFMRELTLNAFDINQVKHESRHDTAPEDQKRVELHLHTTMSQMDATNNIADYVKQAKAWGQPAIAITDHAGVQGFPDAFNSAAKNGVKMIYGVEANLVDDGVPIGYNDKHVPLKGATYVIFDVETTGLSAIYDKVIELSAVKMQDKNVVAQFEEFIDPGFHLSEQTTELTSITDDMVRGSKSEEEVFRLFREFIGDAIVVGHNVTFDIGFMNTGYRRHDMPEIENPIIDTLTLARFLYPTLKGYRLNTLAKKFKVALEHHHRAIYDAETTGHLNYLFLKDAEDRYGIQFHDELNHHMSDNDAYKHARPSHAIILAKTQEGLKNLFKLVSLSNVEYYYRVPRVPRSQLTQLRDGLIVGSACDSGEVFTAMMQKGWDEAVKVAKYYDYLEVQPHAAYQPLIESGLIQNKKHLEEIIANIVKLGEELDKPVVATGDVHFLNPEDYIYRKILIHSQGGANPLNRQELPDVHFRTTDEMLADFAFLGEDVAQKIVVTNTNQIADSIDEVHPLKDKLYTPKMEGAEQEIEERTMRTAHEFYGENFLKLFSNGWIRN